MDELWEDISLPSMPSFATGSSSAAVAPRAQQKEDSRFYFDRRGDWDALQYETIYQRAVPKYSCRCSHVLGWRTEVFYEPSSTESGAFTVRTVSKGRPPSCTERNRAFRDGICPDPDRVVSSSDRIAGDVVLITAAMQQPLLAKSFLQRQRELNEILRTSPQGSIQAWLDLAQYQVHGQLSRLATAERRLAILERGIAETRSDQLRLQRLHCLGDAGYTPAQQLSQWEKEVRLSGSFEMWNAYIRFRLCELHSFTFSSVLELVEEAPYGDRLTALYVQLLFDCGYTERAMAVLNSYANALLPLSDEQEPSESPSWLQVECYRERRYWMPHIPGTMDDMLAIDLEREVAPEEVASWIPSKADCVENALALFGLPALDRSPFLHFAPSAWSDTAAVLPSALRHVLTWLPGTTVGSLLDEGEVGTIWSLACDPMGGALGLSPLELVPVWLPPAQLTCILELLSTMFLEKAHALHAFFYTLLLRECYTQSAQSWAREQLAANDRNAPLLLAYGRFLQLSNLTDDAIRVYSVMWDMCPERVHRWLAEAYIRQRRVDAAADVLVAFHLGLRLSERITPVLRLKAKERSPLLALLLDGPAVLPHSLSLVAIVSYLHPDQFHQERTRALLATEGASFAERFLAWHRILPAIELRQRVAATGTDLIFMEILLSQLHATNASRPLSAFKEHAAHEPFIWQWYIRYAVQVGIPDIKPIVYAAVRACPGAKDLYLLAIRFGQLSEHEIAELVCMAEEKELRIRTRPEELQ